MSEVEAESEKMALLQSEEPVQFTMSEVEAESKEMALLQSEHVQQSIRDLLLICEA